MNALEFFAILLIIAGAYTIGFIVGYRSAETVNILTKEQDNANS